MDFRIKMILFMVSSVFVLFVLKECENEDRIDMTKELIETIETMDTIESIDNMNVKDKIIQNRLVLAKQNGLSFSSQIIEIYFNQESLAEEVFVKETYYSVKEAKDAYKKALEEEVDNQLMLDGKVFLYNAIDKFEYKGKTKQEVMILIEDLKEKGSLDGYEIYWE